MQHGGQIRHLHATTSKFRCGEGDFNATHPLNGNVQRINLVENHQ